MHACVHQAQGLNGTDDDIMPIQLESISYTNTDSYSTKTIKYLYKNMQNNETVSFTREQIQITLSHQQFIAYKLLIQLKHKTNRNHDILVCL